MQQVVTPAEAVVHGLGEITFTSYVTPTGHHGDLACWRVELPAGTPATPHVINRQEVHAVLTGEFTVIEDDGTESVARPGDVIVAPADSTVRLANAGTEPATAWVTVGHGFAATMPDGSTFTPPWAS